MHPSLAVSIHIVAGAIGGLLPNSGPGSDTTAMVSTILSIVFGIVGALAFLFITISGFRYIVSAGDPQKTAQAKEGIIYSLVGLAVAVSAESIVSFFVHRIG